MPVSRPTTPGRRPSPPSVPIPAHVPKTSAWTDTATERRIMGSQRIVIVDLCRRLVKRRQSSCRYVRGCRQWKNGVGEHSWRPPYTMISASLYPCPCVCLSPSQASIPTCSCKPSCLSCNFLCSHTSGLFRFPSGGHHSHSASGSKQAHCRLVNNHHLGAHAPHPPLLCCLSSVFLPSSLFRSGIEASISWTF